MSSASPRPVRRPCRIVQSDALLSGNHLPILQTGQAAHRDDVLYKTLLRAKSSDAFVMDRLAVCVRLVNVH